MDDQELMLSIGRMVEEEHAATLPPRVRLKS